MRAMTSRERRLVALLILMALITAIWLVMIGPIIAGFSERAERRQSLIQQYQANERIIGSIPRLRRQAERQRSAMRDFTYAAPTAMAASAALQARVQRTIETAGGEVRAIDESGTTTSQTKVQASAKLTLAQFADALARLQNEPPYLSVEALSITSDEALVTGKLETMEVSFEVSLPVIAAQPR